MRFTQYNNLYEGVMLGSLRYLCDYNNMIIVCRLFSNHVKSVLAINSHFREYIMVNDQT